MLKKSIRVHETGIEMTLAPSFRACVQSLTCGPFYLKTLTFIYRARVKSNVQARRGRS
jgi:hypothetical protein